LSNAMMSILRSEKLQRMLRALRDGVLSGIEPVVKFSVGVEYPAINDFFGSIEEANRALMLLGEIGLLSSEIVDNVAVCPQCQSHMLMIRMRCPSCGSPRLVRGAMIEHLACGHIDFEERFKVEGRLICPRCGKPLGSVGSDYRTFSFLYRCLSCRSVFSSPRIEHSCSNGHSFGEGDLAIRAVRAFRLNPEKLSLLKRLTFNIEEVFKPLRDGGLIVDSPAEVYGETGVKHEFSFAVWDSVESRDKGEAPIIVGSVYASEGAVTAVDVLAFWAKALDAHARHKFMIALGNVDKGGRDLAEVYGIKLIEGLSSSEVLAKARAMIGEVAEAARREKETALMEETPHNSGKAVGGVAPASS